MRRAAALVLVMGSQACTRSTSPPFPLPEVAPRAPWGALERKCARGDDAPYLERMFVGEDRHEQLLVPLGIEPALRISQSWFALGKQDPGLAPFQWSWLMPEIDDPEARHTITVGVELVSPHALELSVVPMSSATGQLIIHALLERRRDGAVVGTLEGGWFSGPSPFKGRWEDLTGALRVSTPAWTVPGQVMAVHIELWSATSAACGQILVEVPPPGQPRRMDIPTALTHLRAQE